MKTKEELNAVKAESEAVSQERQEVTDEELTQFAGGMENMYKKQIELFKYVKDRK